MIALQGTDHAQVINDLADSPFPVVGNTATQLRTDPAAGDMTQAGAVGDTFRGAVVLDNLTVTGRAASRASRYNPRMICRIHGILDHLEANRAELDLDHGLHYEVLLGAYTAQQLAGLDGQPVSLYTLHFLEGAAQGTTLVPRLAGFLTETDRRCFALFTTVKGVGVRKALRALVRRPAEVAAAIASKDQKFLTTLPEIGRRTAAQIIAELGGKVDAFAAEAVCAQGRELSEAAAEALAVLVQLGERRAEAAALIQRVLAVAPELDSPEAIIQQAYRLKASGV